MLLASVDCPAVAGHTVYGVGSKSCEEWTAMRKLPGQTLLFESWLSGYVSGANGAGFDMAPSEVREMVEFVDQRCRSHPLDMIYEAAATLIETLRAVPAAPTQ